MQLAQTFRLAFKSIASSKMRSFLTMLGIIIGVAAVIILVGLVGGFSNDLTSAFEGMGTNSVSVSIMRSNKLKVEDMQQFAEGNSDTFAAFSPTINLGATVKYETESIVGTLSGVNELYQEIQSLNLSSGRFVSYMDCENRQKVCVIGAYQASELFGGEDPVGQSLRINGYHFNVIGVIAESDGASEGSADDCIYLPYTTTSRLGGGMFSSYVYMTRDVEEVTAASDLLTSYLTKELGSEDYFSVTSAQAMADTVNELTGTLTMVLVGIAGISLLVGGIGIMNIMIVSVTERTREIGIRKSIGARRRDVLQQFLIEAAVTSSLGGIIGIVVGIGGSIPLAKLLGMEAAVSLAAVLIFFSVSAGIGIIFGYFPARKAARLNPIDALKHE